MNELMLFYGGNLKCSVFTVRNPTISQIVEYGKANDIKDMYSIYELGIQLFTAHPYDYMVMLDDLKIDYEEFDKFELFKLLYTHSIKNSNNSAFLDDFFKFMFNEEYTFRLFTNDDGNLIIMDTKRNIEITGQIHSELFNLFSLLHGLNNRSNDIIFGQQILKKLYIKKARKKILKNIKNNRHQHSLLSGKIIPLLKLYNGAISMDNIFDLNMYTMTELLNVGIKKDNYDNIMIGIYTGNIDSKTIDSKTFDWTNIY